MREKCYTDQFDVPKATQATATGLRHLWGSRRAARGKDATERRLGRAGKLHRLRFSSLCQGARTHFGIGVFLAAQPHCIQWRLPRFGLAK
jgi:hypothetical protein